MRRWLSALALALVGVLIAVDAAPALAAASGPRRRKEQLDRRIDNLRREIEEASEEEAELLDELHEVAARRSALDARAAELAGQVAAVRADLAAAQSHLDAVEHRLRVTTIKLQAAEEQLTAAKDELRNRAVAAYIGQPGTEAAGVMLRVRSVEELSSTTGYLQAVVEAQIRAVGRYRALRDEIDDLRIGLESDRTVAAEQRDVVAARTTELERAQDAQESARAAVITEERQQNRLLDRVRQRRAQYEEEVAALQRESDSIADLLRRVQAGQGITLSGRGVLGIPVPGARISSTYGPRVHPIYGTVRIHAGMDFAAPSGTPIRSAADGVVLFAGARGGYGNTVIIDHGGSIATLYAHQSRILVAPGQRVGRGHVIGHVGSTGLSTGPHLHFEVRRAGTPVDPLPYL